jgi:hypothetical protein
MSTNRFKIGDKVIYDPDAEINKQESLGVRPDDVLTIKP